MKAVAIGVSPDSTKSHRNFIAKKELGIRLLSDPEHEVLIRYGVWQLKKMAGREYYGVVRGTYLIDPQGNIAFIWSKAKVKGHVEQARDKLAELQQVE